MLKSVGYWGLCLWPLCSWLWFRHSALGAKAVYGALETPASRDTGLTKQANTFEKQLMTPL